MQCKCYRPIASPLGYGKYLYLSGSDWIQLRDRELEIDRIPLKSSS
ncbi:hypothetical protein [Coleofasciculus sp. H7-2]